MVIAVVFPGQGSQKVGMLREVSEKSIIVKETYSEASEILGFDLWALVQEGPTEELTDTRNTQPALLAASVSLWRVWQETRASVPDYLAGHSLGEYSALVCAGVLKYQDAARLVRKRGELMSAAVPAGEGAMAAIMGLEDKQIVECCEKVDGEVTAANYNAPGQVVIAGENLAVDRAIEIAKEFGAKRAVKLDVSGPFHSRLMLGARDEFAKYIKDIEFSSPVIPVIQNVNVEISNDVEQIKSNLVDQLSSPVRWTETMHKLVGLGVDQIVECGPGAVLRGLAKRTSRELSLAGLDTVVDMENFLGS